MDTLMQFAHDYGLASAALAAVAAWCGLKLATFTALALGLGAAFAIFGIQTGSAEVSAISGALLFAAVATPCAAYLARLVDGLRVVSAAVSTED